MQEQRHVCVYTRVDVDGKPVKVTEVASYEIKDWGKLSPERREIVAEVSRRNPIAIQKLLVLQKTNPSLRNIKVFVDQDNQDDDSDDY